MRAGLIGTDAYLGEWRREARECGDDLDAEVAEEVAWLEGAYTEDVLERLVALERATRHDGHRFSRARPARS